MEKEINTEIDAIKKVYNQEDAVEKNRSTRLKHQILSKEIFPLVLGGEHSITPGSIKPFVKK